MQSRSTHKPDLIGGLVDLSIVILLVAAPETTMLGQPPALTSMGQSAIIGLTFGGRIFGFTLQAHQRYDTVNYSQIGSFTLSLIVLWLGFAWSRLTRRPVVDDERAREELRSEQRARFRSLLRGGATLDPTALPGGGPAFWAGEADEQRDTLRDARDP